MNFDGAPSNEKLIELIGKMKGFNVDQNTFFVAWMENGEMTTLLTNDEEGALRVFFVNRRSILCYIRLSVENRQTNQIDKLINEIS